MQGSAPCRLPCGCAEQFYQIPWTTVEHHAHLRPPTDGGCAAQSRRRWRTRCAEQVAPSAEGRPPQMVRAKERRRRDIVRAGAVVKEKSVAVCIIAAAAEEEGHCSPPLPQKGTRRKGARRHLTRRLPRGDGGHGSGADDAACWRGDSSRGRRRRCRTRRRGGARGRPS